MGEIIQEESSHKKGGKRRPKKHSTHIDMTPMVDLMCLLITFFMLTTAFSKPKAIEIVLPDKDTTGVKPTPIDPKRALTIILAEDNKIYYYEGNANPNKPPLPSLIETDYSNMGIRMKLLQRNKALFEQIDELKIKAKEGKLEIPVDFKTKIAEEKVKESNLTGKEAENAKREIEKAVKVDDYIKSQIKDLKNEDKAGPIVLIKAYKNVKYKNFVDIIDEMAIANIARYAVVDINAVDINMVEVKMGIAAPMTVAQPQEENPR